MSADALPAVATRGRTFAVAHMDRADALGRVVVGNARWTALADACKAVTAIDWRLSPRVILVEKASA